MRIRYVIAILILAAIAGCVANPTGPWRERAGVPGHVEGALPSPELGIIADEKMQVVDLLPLGAAAQAGVQIGDVLVSIEPAPPLPPGQEPTPYPLPQDVVVIEVDQQGTPLAPTPLPGQSTYIPGSPLVAPTPAILLEPAAAATIAAATATAAVQLTAVAATPTTSDPAEVATIEAMQATTVALAATSEARVAEERYRDCLAYTEAHPDYPKTKCLPPGGEVLTNTVFFTEAGGEWAKAKIFTYPPQRMILTVLRDGQEIKIEVIPGPPTGRPDRDPQATPTPIPPSYYFF